MPSEIYARFVDSKKVVLGVETHEYNIDIDKLGKTIKSRLASQHNIVIKEHCNVVAIQEENYHYEISYEDSADGKIHHEQCDQVINATWDHRYGIDSLIGISPSVNFTSRLKILALVALPDELYDAPSMMFVRGPFGMFSNKGNGEGFLTYAPVTNYKAHSTLACRKSWDEAITSRDLISYERALLGQKIIEGVSQYIPAMKTAQLLEVRMGTVNAPGDGDIYDKNSLIHKRDSSGVHHLKRGWYSLDTGKLVLAPYHARTLMEIMTKDL